MDKYLQGSNLQGWSAPDITNDKVRGLGGWSADEVIAYLKTGHNHITAATGPMAEAVSLSTSRMTDGDLKAITTYLKSLPGRQDNANPLRPDEPMMAAGGAIYRDECSACHALDGKGVPRLSRRLPNRRSYDQTIQRPPYESYCVERAAWRQRPSLPLPECPRTDGSSTTPRLPPC
jgi:mono/diheme cytochrome c family protein